MNKELSNKLSGISLVLRQATEGWCVTYETPKETREWIGRLHLEAERSARRLEEIQDLLEEVAK